MVLALDTLSTNLKFLNSKRDYLHSQGNMGISMRFTKSAITLYLVLNTMMDGSHPDAGGLRAKAMYNHRPSFPSYIPAKATSPETSDSQQPKGKHCISVIWTAVELSRTIGLPSGSGVEFYPKLSDQHESTTWSGWVPRTAPRSLIGNSCLMHIHGVIWIYDLLVMKRWQIPDGQHTDYLILQRNGNSEKQTMYLFPHSWSLSHSSCHDVNSVM